MALLEINDLAVRFETNDGIVSAVNGVSFNVNEGDTLAIVGESGSGKSQTAFAAIGLLARNGHATGSVKWDGQEILNLPESKLNRIRSSEIAMIFQDPMTSLNPFMRVSDQMEEVLTLHRGMSRRAARVECVRMLDAVRIPDAAARITMYPHEFSGGMRQRIMIAMSLLCRPRLLIADEPTTALDVTVQAQIMKLLRDVQDEFNTALILITHDLGIVAGSCERTMVMYGGRIMERGPTEEIFETPTHPYTLGLLEAVPRLDRREEVLPTIPGEPPDMMRDVRGCPFEPRCPLRIDRCTDDTPPLERIGETRVRACHRSPEEVR
ncbi:oligopeptide/dipeptide ABC transporter ATP-binding protein [Tropicimonas sp. IMCC6043]|uniref:oligopeptide/dipeptide ABC transporter ATP-binding protein n=1 Tax=Tropicimonas sp. IMCC6043 TaxID=2510645 RepID=UPI00101C24DB|nr:oligopeptide/dipeptide ABC transporter ATP-binding protein [Tropicimonas sp. IMCC6043]RYH08943.1 ATP-binding cassette domain-containing protein [Tropicimonas sp. IMCC6043]